METYIKSGNILLDFVVFVATLKQLSIFYKDREMLETKIQSECVNTITLELILGNRKE